MARPLPWHALLCTSLSLAFATCTAGIRLELTHVDAKEGCTVDERMRRATERTQRGVAAPVRWSTAEYIAEYLVGDPPQRTEAVVDTGSDLIWTQCATCVPNCFGQILPTYNSSQSRTVRPVPCNDTLCGAEPWTRCPRDGGTACAVGVSYGGKQLKVSGSFGTDVFTFGSERVTLAFGCVTAAETVTGLTAPLDGASGVLGLGRGPLSLISQLGETKFSYCLTPYFGDNVTESHLFVGASAALTGDAPVTTVPFVKNPKEEGPFFFGTFYYVPLVGMTVGKAKLAVPASAFDLREVTPRLWAGGAVVDSGDPFTRLVDVAYRALREELARQLGSSLVLPPANASIVLDLCVASGNMSSLVPPLVLHFGSGGGDVVLPPGNYWAPVDKATACMVVFNSAARPNGTLPWNETTVIGNTMQQDMHLLFDLGEGVLSFQPADCSSM